MFDGAIYTHVCIFQSSSIVFIIHKKSSFSALTIFTKVIIFENLIIPTLRDLQQSVFSCAVTLTVQFRKIDRDEKIDCAISNTVFTDL